MAVYFALLAAVTAVGIPLCSKKCGKWGKIVYCVIFAVAFVILSAVRYMVGYDYNSYSMIYNDLRFFETEDIAANRIEKGFLLPLYVLSLGFEDYYVVFIYTSVIIYTAVFALICCRSEKPWISAASFLCFGLFFNSLCFLRQFMAALIIAYAVKFVCDGRYLRFLILVIAAGTFHWSALIMAALMIFIKIRPSWKYLGVVTAGTVVFCIFSRKVMVFLTDKFYMYNGYNIETSVEASRGLPPRYTIMFGIVFIICFLFKDKLIEKNPNNGVYLNCLMFTVVFEAMGMRHGILSRFAILTYIPPLLFMLPDAVSVIGEWIEEKKGRFFTTLSAVGASAFAVGCYLVLMINNYNGVIPYTSQFDIQYETVDSAVTEPDEATDEAGDGS